MEKKYLIVNTGSASKKYSLYESEKEVIRVHLEKVAEGFLCNLSKDGNIEKITATSSDYENSVEYVINSMIAKGVISKKEDISAIGIRVVAPSDYFAENRIVDDEFVGKLEEVKEEAPIHLSLLFSEIKSLKNNFGGIPLIATSDSAFHKEMPLRSRLYAIPVETSKELDLYRFGFHGISIRSILSKVEKTIGNLPSKVIVCHLGGGSSITAVKDGKSVDTSMGLTPLEGLPMATRVGDIDPGAILYLMRRMKKTPDEIANFLNYECGLKGLSGRSADLRELIKAEGEGDVNSKTAIEILSYRIKKYIGSYIASLNGLDLLVFSGTIGEFSYILRSRICENLDCFGISLDNEKNNNTVGADGFIEKENSSVKIAVVNTDEMLEIAKETSVFFN